MLNGRLSSEERLHCIIALLFAMIGRKIIQVYPDENTFSPVQPNAGLPIRKLKSAGLRIITENEPMAGDMLRLPEDRLSSRRTSETRSAVTVNSSHTFGRPNPSTESAEHTPDSGSSLCGSTDSLAESTVTRRQKRYSREEEALKSTLQHVAPEPTHRELQIRALERATALLTSHAQEAQDRAEKLRDLLNDRDIDPESYQSLQKERWMEERRSQARLEESKALEELLKRIAEDPDTPIPPLPDSVQQLEQTHIARKDANLLEFFKHSPTRLTFPNRSRHFDIEATLDPSSRRRTKSDIRVMRLRTSALVMALAKPIKTRLRSKSLDAGGEHPSKVPLKRVDTSTPSGSGLSPLTETSTPTAMAPKSKMSPQVRQRRPSSLFSFGNTNSGTATIYAPGLPRTADEIAAELNDVGLPEYAQDLLDRFVSVDSNVSALQSAPISVASATPPRNRSSRFSFHVPKSPLRKPISAYFTSPGHSRKGSHDSSIGSGSARADSSERTYGEKDGSPTHTVRTPSGSYRSSTRRKEPRRSLPTPSSPSMLSKVRNRLSVLGKK
ncbi:hypothetical protein ABKN59_006347 [Abortiporus biennis]